MLIKNCEFCGGELEVNEDMSVGVCKYCDSINVIPKELERKGRLYNRAVFLRQNKEFDKALSVYEDILKEDNSDADAHWGLILSKYGIEYVLDSRTGKRIPTCHRTQSDPILSDPDYWAAIENADIEAKRVIEAEAKRISEIQKRILEISQNEPPYDVFICYKETDESGKRTEDSILAQDLYYELEKKGYKVFFARKTLESKLGTEYEPIIFAALNTSKVMIVVGTKAEHFNAVWVRNEWSRFLKMSHNSSKVIIPAYRGISPYELPDELSVLQSQDMSKLGFMQDLTDGIDKILHANSTSSTSPLQKNTVESFAGSLDRLLQNGETYLKLSDYNRAKEVYTKITQEYPESYQGWWGLIVCDTKDFTNTDVDESKINTYFEYTETLSDKETFNNIQPIYTKYVEKLGDAAADAAIKEVKDKISRHNAEISKIKAHLNFLQSDKSRKTSAHSELKKNYEKDLELAEMELNKNYSARSSDIKLSFVGVAILIFSAIILHVGGGWGVFFGLVGFFVGIMMSTTSADKGYAIFIGVCTIIFAIITIFQGGWNILWGILVGTFALMPTIMSVDEKETSKALRDISNSTTKIKQIKDKINSSLNNHEQELKKINNDIKKDQDKIVEIEKKISTCNDFLGLGHNAISTAYGASKLKKFGVERFCDETVFELGAKAIGVNAEAVNKSEYHGQPILPKIEKREDIIEGEIYSATVTKIMQFGAFVKIDNSDFEGLIHISKLSLDKNIRFKRVEDAVSVGDAVDVLIEQIDSMGRISCALIDNSISNYVCAPMYGTIKQINVHNGSVVKKGDVLCILEAMMMENEVCATTDCTITSVEIDVDQKVQANDKLFLYV